MDFKAELNTQITEEEDCYYAEIRKQISLLLTAYDDDDEVEQLPKTAAKPGAEVRQRDCWPQLERNMSLCPNGNDFDEPVWHVNSWENGNGTGVFIPQAVKYKKYCVFSMFLF